MGFSQTNSADHRRSGEKGKLFLLFGYQAPSPLATFATISYRRQMIQGISVACRAILPPHGRAAALFVNNQLKAGVSFDRGVNLSKLLPTERPAAD